jgi:L-alanine-DL-glutamate epimerase-like enolase superfamily enzyme
MKVILHEMKMPMRHPFTITHGTTVLQHNVIVELQAEGLSGYGEAASSRAWPEFSPATVRQGIQEARSFLETCAWERPEELWAALHSRLGHNPFALCAVDEAAHDLWGKRLGAPVWKLWGLSIDQVPVSNYTIGLDSVDRMVAKLNEFPGWPVYKIKLGSPHDLEIMRELRHHTAAVFRVDANTAWTVEQTLNLAPELLQLGVEFIEQPLPRGDIDGMKRLLAECPLPLIADESCQEEADVERCAGLFHGINIKLTKAGGLTPARRMIQRARELGLKVMVGCMNESSAGISAIGQLLPLLDYVDMDGSVLIARDPARGVFLDHGKPVFPETAGNGVSLIPEILEELRVPLEP